MRLPELGDDPTWFPAPHTADGYGLLAVGGDVSPERLVAAYSRGIFPWYAEDEPLLWYCPAPRFVLFPDELHVPRRLQRLRRQRRYRVTLDTAFEEVIARCAEPRPEQDGTWLTRDLVASMTVLHERGIAHSVETWDGDRLVGGMYGLAIGRVFFGESMFNRAPNASKLAIVELVEQLRRWDFALLDCQMPSDHVARLGARPIPLVAFLEHLAAAVATEGPPSPWRFDTERTD